MHNLEVLAAIKLVYRNAKGTFFGTISVTSSSGLYDIVSESGKLLTICCPEKLEPWANSAALSVLMYNYTLQVLFRKTIP